MPSIFEIKGYKIYFWKNENDEPIHVHISKGNPTANSTKVWLTQSGGCIVCHNKSKIPEKELSIICEDIALHYFQIVEKWKIIHSGNVKFYC